MCVSATSSNSSRWGVSETWGLCPYQPPSLFRVCVVASAELSDISPGYGLAGCSLVGVAGGIKRTDTRCSRHSSGISRRRRSSTRTFGFLRHHVWLIVLIKRRIREKNFSTVGPALGGPSLDSLGPQGVMY